MREIVLDTETTGLDYKRGDRIIEVACVELLNHVQTGNHLQFYCSTSKTINESAEKIHGLSNSFLNKHPTFAEQSEKLINFIKNDVLIIHNADFDLGFINHELKLKGDNVLTNNFIDTVALARKKINTRYVSLDHLCKRFLIDISSRKFHGALLDCQLLSEVYLELLGGRQTHLELDRSNNVKVEDFNSNEKIKKESFHKVELTEEEIENHKEFISELNKSLWKKIKY